MAGILLRSKGDFQFFRGGASEASRDAVYSPPFKGLGAKRAMNAFSEIPANVTPCQDLARYETVAKFLAAELSGFSLGAEPLDVAETIELLTEEMEDMPEVIADCRQAVEAFSELESVLDRMFSLADRAVELNDSDPRALAALDEEFAAYGHLIARLAGDSRFAGTVLSLATSAEAKVTRVILGYLAGARRDFREKLDDQRRRINCAMDEALVMLARILDEGEEISFAMREDLTDLLAKLAALAPEARAVAEERLSVSLYLH